MSAFAHQPTITLEIKRCWECGAFWAIENGRTGTCPCCAQRKIDRAYADEKKLEHRLNAQKAATTRALRGKR
jgi:hypothetical protein